jgi:hypothetical protein
MWVDRGRCQKSANTVWYSQKIREAAAQVAEGIAVAGMLIASQVVRKRWYIARCNLARGNRNCSLRNVAEVAVAVVENRERQSVESEHRQSMCCCYRQIDYVGHCCRYMRLERMADMRLIGSHFAGRRRIGDCSLGAVAVVVPGIVRDCRNRRVAAKADGGNQTGHVFGSSVGRAVWCLYSKAESFRHTGWVRPRHCRAHSSLW